MANDMEHARHPLNVKHDDEYDQREDRVIEAYHQLRATSLYLPEMVRTRVEDLVDIVSDADDIAYGTGSYGELYELLVLHRTEQERERQHAGTEWREGGWMFAQPIDPRRDLADWKALLKDAGVRDARLHDARHTAATVLLLLGVPDRAVMDFMGWSNTAMAKRYQHMTAVLRDNIAKRLSGFLWQESKPTSTMRCPTCGRGPVDN